MLNTIFLYNLHIGMSIHNKRTLIKILNELGSILSFKIMTHSDGWIIELQKNNKSYLIYGYNFPNNNAAASRLCDDKSGVYEVLTKHQCPAIPHFFFMNPKNPNSIEKNITTRANKLLQQYRKIVVKPNNGTGGDCVFLVETPTQLKDAINKIFNRFDYLTISPYQNIKNEYRVIMLNNKPMLIYEKIKCNGEWRHNLQHGANASIVVDKLLTTQLTKLARMASNVININFSSIDIVRVKDKFYILEINSGVMLEKFALQSKDNYIISKSIYKKALESIF
ncbi:MAG: ATP-grasp domain-containing protein [Mycoplasmataceae bacterium]|nr:ATP-grasp domain-containing protein [Mycoplasmataceae bacterium]